MTICQKLRITDGISISDLLNPSPGIHLNNWTPQIQQPKQDGVFQDSPLASGRRRVYSQFANATESFNFKVNDLTRNKVLQHISDLLILLEKAIEYWETDYQNTPIYLEVQTADGNTQYAIIKSYTFLELDNPFAQPFFTTSQIAFDELNLNIERGDWLDQIPGSSEAVSTFVIGSEYSSNGITFTPSIYMPTNITHIYVDNGGVFGSNLVASTAFNLLPAAPAINDAIYFGNDNNEPIFSAIFDIGTAWTGTSIAGVWEEYRSGSWGTIITQNDETDDFTTTGVNGFWYLPSTATQQVTINSVAGNWIRFRVTTATGVTTVPTQQNRIVYCANDSVLNYDPNNTNFGTLPSLAKIEIRNDAGIFTADRNFIIGLRSTSRGSNFYPWINLSSVNQISGITIGTGASGSGIAETAYLYLPTASALFYDASSATITNRRRWSIEFDTTIAPNYISGKYRVYMFMRNGLGSTGENFSTFFRLENGDRSVRYWQSKTVEYNTPSVYERIDYGVMTIPNIDNTDLTLDFYSSADGNTNDIIYLAVLVLPVDEFALYTDFGLTGSGSGASDGQVNGDRYLVVDGTNHKMPIQTTMYKKSDNTVYGILSNTVNGEIIIKENSKLWIFPQDLVQTPYAKLYRMSLDKIDRFLSLRGSL